MRVMEHRTDSYRGSREQNVKQKAADFNDPPRLARQLKSAMEETPIKSNPVEKATIVT